MRKSLLLVVLACWMMGCLELVTGQDEAPVPESVLGEVEYIIPAGKHSARYEHTSLNVDSLYFRAMFDSSAIYRTKNSGNQGDINKLLGLSDCEDHHQVNSARFGWRWYKDQLQILAYTYVNAKRSFRYIGNVEIGTYNTFSIALEDGSYVFRLNEQELRMPRNCSGGAKGYGLYPYFGGDEPAPHAVKIKVRTEQPQQD